MYFNEIKTDAPFECIHFECKHAKRILKTFIIFNSNTNIISMIQTNHNLSKLRIFILKRLFFTRLKKKKKSVTNQERKKERKRSKN